MKTNTLLLLGMLAGSTTTLLGAEREVEVSELPFAVKKTLANEGRGETAKKIVAHEEDGRTVYTFEFGRRDSRLRVAEDGGVIIDTRAGPAANDVGRPTLPVGYPAYPGGVGEDPFMTPVVPSLTLDDIPEAARETVRRESNGREIASIHVEKPDGKTAYVAQFRESGRNPRVYVAEDGEVLRPTEKPPALLVGTRFNDTPDVVQKSIRRTLGDGEIVKINRDRDRRGGRDVYRIEARDARGEYRFSVTEDGRVMENSRQAETR